MSRSQLALILHALLLIAALSYLVPSLTEALGGPRGFLLALILYWLGFCVPVTVWHVGRQHSAQLLSERLAWRDWFVPVLLLVQVTVVAFAALVPNTTLLTTNAAALAAVVGVINAPLEELAWRGGFMTRFAAHPRLGFWVSWVLFSLWHLPLTFSHGMHFEGGGLALVGGAAALGLLWSWIAWRTGSVFWVSIAHGLTNIITFWVLFDSNGVMAALAYQS